LVEENENLMKELKKEGVCLARLGSDALLQGVWLPDVDE